MILVPLDNPGYRLVRNISIMGDEGEDYLSHGEVEFTNCRVPKSHLIGEEGQGFTLAQVRLGPGRIHHCMRWIGICERALGLMCDRAMSRELNPGKFLSGQQTIQNWIAESRIEIEQARLLVLKCAWMIDTHGAKAARKEIAAIKVAVPRMAQQVVDRAIQVHGGAGVSQDTVLAGMYAGIRALRIVDGPDEVHIRDIARMEIKP